MTIPQCSNQIQQSFYRELLLLSESPAAPSLDTEVLTEVSARPTFLSPGAVAAIFTGLFLFLLAEGLACQVISLLTSFMCLQAP